MGLSLFLANRWTFQGRGRGARPSKFDRESLPEPASLGEIERATGKDGHMRAVQVSSPGGPEVLTVVDLDLPEPSPTQTLVQVRAAGVNYIDTYFRTGAYPRPMPFVVGSEGAGLTTAGQRVAWALQPNSYAEWAAIETKALVPIPHDVTDDQAAAVMLQGMTVHYLLDGAAHPTPGDTVFITAGAGGVGLLFLQWAKSKGIKTITTVSTQEKKHLALQAGADHVILHGQENIVDTIKDLTNGKGVQVAYDGVGAATFEASIASTARRGTVVLFGAASGPVPPFDLQRLNSAGSLSVTRPTLSHFIADRDELLWRGGEILQAVSEGTLTVHIHKKYSLEQAADAHRDIESGKTTGKLLIAS